jgi:transcriptional regulator with XRE-family HTH domain
MGKKSVLFQNVDRLVDLGIAIASVRKMKGLSQEELAEKAHISRSYLSDIENPNSVRKFSIQTLFNIVDALDVSADDLLKTKISDIY